MYGSIHWSNTRWDDDIIRCTTVCKHIRSTSTISQSAISKYFRRRVSCLRHTISPVHTRCTSKRQFSSLYSQLPDYTVRTMNSIRVTLGMAVTTGDTKTDTALTLRLRSPEGPVSEAGCLHLRPHSQQLSTHAGGRSDPRTALSLKPQILGAHPRPCSSWPQHTAHALRRHATLGAGLGASWVPFGILTSRGFVHDLQVSLNATPSQC